MADDREGQNESTNRSLLHSNCPLATARKVGMRYGRPVILAIDTIAMQQAGYSFYCSENGVWLVDEVPASYLRVLKKD